MYLYLLPLPSLDNKSLAILVNNLQSIENVINGHLEGSNLQDKTITDIKIADGTLTRRVMSDDIPRTVGGQYTGDDTASREINIGFMPRFVIVVSHTDSIIFMSIGDGASAMASWWWQSTGAISTGSTDWQGISANGFTTGTNTASLSNKKGYLYSYFAIR